MKCLLMQASYVILQVQINEGIHNCPSRARVPGCSMASHAWVAERAIRLLKRKPGMGPKAVQDELQVKYKIEITYQTVVYGRQRAANKLFGKWDDSFNWLYRFKAEVEIRSATSILEIDTETGGQGSFQKVFLLFQGYN